MIRLAIVNDYELVVAGVAAMLAGERSRIRVTALDPMSADDVDNVDVILYDTFGPVEKPLDCLDRLIGRGGAPVVIYSWDLRPDVVREAMDRGASGYLSKTMTGAQIAAAVEEVALGTVVVDRTTSSESAARGDWPGRLAGLSVREAEIITMIAAGMSNQEIADLSYLSINSVKTYIRSGYRKIGARRRTQAVLWAVENGFVATPGTSAPTERALQ